MDLDICHVLRHGREIFPFDSALFCLFFERFLETRLRSGHSPPRSLTEVRMCMWRQIMPKRGFPEYSTKISLEALALLASEDNHVFLTLAFPYAGIDWRGCPNILFIETKPLYDRGNISVFFKLI